MSILSSLFSSGKGKAGAVGAAAGVLALFITLAQPFEGKRNTAYWDPYGKVWTVCFGETKGVKKGDHYTDEQCDKMLVDRMQRDFDPWVMAALTVRPVPDKARAAFNDLAYNIGVGAFTKSTVAKLWNKSQFEASCKAMLRFNRAGGKVLKGLTRRREAEVKMCLEGVRG